MKNNAPENDTAQRTAAGQKKWGFGYNRESWVKFHSKRAAARNQARLWAWEATEVS
jgi:hypothetical protein